jgi:hypothetical protein
MKQFAEGDKVMVIGPPGAVVCDVFHAASPDQMPDLGPGSLSKEAVDVMREMRVDLMLLLGHEHDGLPVCFWAVHNPNGWVDLHGQELQVRKVECEAQA